MSKKKFSDLSESERVEYARKVKALRQGQNMKQAELALLANVSRATIISLESGSTTPQAKTLADVLAVLGVDVLSPEFEEQTELWLTMIGTLIEAIPEQRRLPSVNAAIRTLTEGIKPSNVIPLRANVGGDRQDVPTEDEAFELDAVAKTDVKEIEEFDDRL